MDREAPEENSSSPNDNLSITSIKGGTTGGDVNISLSDGSSFFISTESALDLTLFPDKELSLEEVATLEDLAAEHGAKKKALDLLSRAEQSRQGLYRKLYKKGFPKDVIDRSLDSFEEKGYLNDRRFAEAWVRSRLRKHPEGSAALIAGLRRRGIDGKTAEAAVTFLVTEEGEWQALKNAVEKLTRRRSLNREKLTARLLRRGFAWGLISRYFGESDKKNSQNSQDWN
jgi:regulatory protein